MLPPRRLQGDHEAEPWVLLPYLAHLLAPLRWLQCDRVASPDDHNLPTTGKSTIVANRPAQQETEGARLMSAFTFFFRMQLPKDAQQSLNSVVSNLPQSAIRKLSEASLRIIPRRRRQTEVSTPLHPEDFPSDVQGNIMSFLQPKDVVTLACVSRSCRDIVDGDGPTATAVWKALWQRDFGWLIQSWEIGRQAYLRSNGDYLQHHGKDFYFRFGLSYVNYVLAGLNTPDHCLVGLHGNIYDITDFVVRHPGSPETLFVHAGRDATNLFDDMDHSRGARRLSKDFCVAVDMSYYGSCGLRPTIEFEADRVIPAIVEAKPVIGKKARRFRRPECLKKIYTEFFAEQCQHQKDFTLKLKDNKRVLHWTLFYDPYQGAWKTWYTSRDFETIFV